MRRSRPKKKTLASPPFLHPVWTMQRRESSSCFRLLRQVEQVKLGAPILSLKTVLCWRCLVTPRNVATLNVVRLLAAAFLVACLIIPAGAQDETSRQVGLPDDWSHHHLIFSNPGTAEEAMRNGTYDRWLRIQNDPRYLMQQIKRYSSPQAMDESGSSVATEGSATETESACREIMPPGPQKKPKPLHRDWSISMGSSAKTPADQYPAKFSFSTTQAFCDSDTTPDFVVYPTDVAGTAATAANGTITFSGAPSISSSAYIQIESIQYFFTSTGSVTAPASAGRCNISTGGSSATAQTNLFDAITAPTSGTTGTYQCTGALNSAVTNVVNTLGTRTITMSGTDGNFTLSEPNGAITSVSVSGGTGGTVGQASIIAYDNLYSGCTAASGLKPLIYWQYNTAAGTVATSPVLSADGKQVAFIQTDSSSHANLVLLKWAKSGAFVTLSSTGAGSYRACTAPCMTVLTFNADAGTTPNDTNSAPFYDYANDIIYVGDDLGYLHKFAGVFNGATPAEVGSTWPVKMTDPSATTPGRLTSPVYDPGSGLVFVGDGRNGSFTGRFHSVIASSGTGVADYGTTLSVFEGILDAPIVDSSAAKEYVFTADDNVLSGACGFSYCTAVWQFPTSLASVTEATVGVTFNTTDVQYDGMFDNTYFTSANPASPTGHLYVNGRDNGIVGAPVLWLVSINSNVMSSGVATHGPTLTSAYATGSPVAEFFNSPTDWIFLSVTGSAVTGTPISCPASAGCIMSFNVTSASGFGTGTTTSATATEASGTSGIVIDNALSSPAGTSQVYFSPLSTQACAGNNGTGSQGQAASGGCAIQASQALLH